MKEVKEGNYDKKKVLVSKMSATVTRKHRFHKNTKGTKFNGKKNIGKSGHYWYGCNHTGRGYVPVCTSEAGKLGIALQLLHLRKAKISTVTPEYTKKSVSTCCSYYVTFQKISLFCWTLGQEEARRGKRKMAVITGKRGQWELVLR